MLAGMQKAFFPGIYLQIFMRVGPGRLGVGIGAAPRSPKIFRNLLASIVIEFIHPDPGS